jgi:peptidyl-prolyl cis-trans isomerase C
MQKISKAIAALIIFMAMQPLSYAQESDKQIATVNGEPIMLSQLLTYAKIKNPQADLNNQTIRNQLIQAYIGRELLYQDARKQKIDQLPLVKVAVENQVHEVVTQAMMAKLLQEKPVTDAEVRSYYDKEIAGRKDAEYKVRHILVKTEEDAKKAIDRLKSGEDFAKVAQMVSIDSSASRGGDLGWTSLSRLPKDFAAAVKNAPVGKYTSKPVHTTFGWHVIKVEQSRPLQIPTFEQAKGQVQKLVTEKRISDYVEGLQKKAKIEFSNGGK